mmetsp:Transcript_9263/g.16115  ORF Transcript_9263/g.16115 Transcript_9263/m.16115 type:complete len:176 (+) Transcript_9263:829-1356(+)
MAGSAGVVPVGDVPDAVEGSGTVPPPIIVAPKLGVGVKSASISPILLETLPLPELPAEPPLPPFPRCVPFPTERSNSKLDRARDGMNRSPAPRRSNRSAAIADVPPIELTGLEASEHAEAWLKFPDNGDATPVRLPRFRGLMDMNVDAVLRAVEVEAPVCTLSPPPIDRFAGEGG